MLCAVLLRTIVVATVAAGATATAPVSTPPGTVQQVAAEKLRGFLKLYNAKLESLETGYLDAKLKFAQVACLKHDLNPKVRMKAEMGCEKDEEKKNAGEAQWVKISEDFDKQILFCKAFLAKCHGAKNSAPLRRHFQEEIRAEKAIDHGKNLLRDKEAELEAEAA